MSVRLDQLLQRVQPIDPPCWQPIYESPYHELASCIQDELHGTIEWQWNTTHSPHNPPIHLLAQALVQCPELGAIIRKLLLRGPKRATNPDQDICCGNTTHWNEVTSSTLVEASVRSELKTTLLQRRGTDTQDSIDDLINGDVRLYSALIVLHAPNLQILELDAAFFSGSSILGHVFRRASEDLSGPEVHGHGPRRLQQLRLNGHGERDYVRDDAAVYVGSLYLPEIESVRAQVSKFATFSWPAPRVPSATTLTSLDFVRTEMNTTLLQQVLACTPNLQVLKYDYWIRADSKWKQPPDRVDLRQLKEALQQVRRTVRKAELSITMYANSSMDVTMNDPYCGLDNPEERLFEDFEVLETLTFPIVYWWGLQANVVDDLGYRFDDLPKSIVNLSISDNLGDWLENQLQPPHFLTQYWKRFLARWRIVLPNLQKITLKLRARTGNSGWFVEERLEFVRMCQAAGLNADVDTSALTDAELSLNNPAFAWEPEDYSPSWHPMLKYAR